MPKLKTNRGAAKRIRVTASGKLKRRHAFKSHIATSKTPKTKRQLRSPNLISPADHKKFLRLLANL